MNTTHQPHPLDKLDGKINTPGGKISLISPDPKDISIFDIAAGLANNCHFGGLIEPKMYFSIADHSLLVAQLAQKENNNPNILLAALLHDASEAYLGDMKKPMKIMAGMEKYRLMEREFQLAIFDHFDLEISMLNEIKKYDVHAQQIEYDTFYKDARLITSFNCPRTSYSKYLTTFSFICLSSYLNKPCDFPNDPIEVNPK